MWFPRRELGKVISHWWHLFSLCITGGGDFPRGDLVFSLIGLCLVCRFGLSCLLSVLSLKSLHGKWLQVTHILLGWVEPPIKTDLLLDKATLSIPAVAGWCWWCRRWRRHRWRNLNWSRNRFRRDMFFAKIAWPTLWKKIIKLLQLEDGNI